MQNQTLNELSRLISEIARQLINAGEDRIRGLGACFLIYPQNPKVGESCRQAVEALYNQRSVELQRQLHDLELQAAFALRKLRKHLQRFMELCLP